MKKDIQRLLCLATITLLPALAAAGDLSDAVKKGGDFLKKEFQKTDLAKAEFNPYNREVNEENRPKAGEFWIGIIGDSSVTGAAANPQFQPNWLNLLGHAGKALLNLHSSNLTAGPGYQSPIRVMYTRGEYDEAKAKNQSLEQKIEADLSQKIDTEEFSFGYIVAQKLNLSPDKLVIAGQDGVRVNQMSRQLERLAMTGGGTLAPLVLASFVANDLCHPDNFSKPIEHFSTAYEADLRGQFEVIANFPPAPGGTKIVFLAPLDIANVLTNANLLQQRVRFENGNVTCQQVRDGQLPGGDLSRQMGQTLIGACRGVLSGGDREARLSQLKNLQNAQATILQKVLTDFNAKNLAIKTEYAASTKSIDFQPGDLANDCFHPSQAGAGRIADQLLTNELASVRR